jgi:hypothetical protein
MVCSHLTTSKPSTKSSQCRLISSTAFSSTAFDVFYARLYCPLGGSAPNRRAAAPPALRATFLHAALTSARRRPAPLTPRSTAGPSHSPAPRVSTFRRTPELRPRDGHRVPASRTIVLHHNSSCACRCSARHTPASPARAHGPALLRPPNTCTGSSARELLHRRNHAAPAPVLARRQFTCVALHQLMPEPFAPTQLWSSLVRSTPAHPFLLCCPAPALSLSHRNCCTCPAPMLLHLPIPSRLRVCVTPARRQLAGHVRVCSWPSRVHFLRASAPSLARAYALAPVHLHTSYARSALLLP